MFAAGKKLVGLDLKNGKDAWPALDLGFMPLHPPRFADVDGDGRFVALLQRRKENEPIVELRVLSLTARQIRWQVEFLQEREHNSPERDWLSVADLHGDGKPEVILPSQVLHLPTDRYSSGLSAGVQVRDGATGEVRWQRRWRFVQIGFPVEIRIITGPDLDGDGWKDVFAAWTAVSPDRGDAKLHVAALSGNDGRVLWRWTQPGFGHDPPAPLRWWHPGPDGWPMLITSIRQGGQPITYVLSGGTGKLLHTLPEVSDSIVADFNGDGILDLAYTISPQGAARCLVIPGKSPEPFRALDRWQAMQDFDGDGVVDFLSLQMPPPTLLARSGRGDRNLWQANVRIWMSHDIKLSPPLPHGDLNGDGHPGRGSPGRHPWQS